MAVQVYYSNDVGAPTLSGTAGALATILKACLVDGYGSKPGAGWTVALDDYAANKSYIFRNDPINGTGRYFVLRDDGNIYVNGAQSSPNIALIHGCESYINISSTLGNFPNLNGDLNPDTYMTSMRAPQIYKSFAMDASVRPWIVVADERTCHVFTQPGWSSSDPFGKDPSLSYSSYYQSVVSFGDIRTRTGISDPNGAYIGAINQGDYNISYTEIVGYKRSLSGPVDGFFLNRSIEGTTGAVEMLLWEDAPAAWTTPLVSIYMGSGHSAIAEAMPYPNPATGGIVLSSIACCENTNAVERTSRHTRYTAGYRGRIPGLYPTPHSVESSASAKLGLFGDTLTINGRDYLILKPTSAGYYVCPMLVDLTGPW